MTRDLRITIEPSDIVAIELECNSCHGRQVIKIGEWKADNDTCPNCGKGFPLSHVDNFRYLFKIAEQLALLRIKSESKEPPPFIYRFELVGDPKDKS